jgi:hypothetical protein
MKIVTWNCNGALRKKLSAVINLDADILVVQECEDPARSNCPDYREWAGNHLWLGQNKSRGLGVFAKPGIKIELARLDPGEFQLFLPCWINGSTLLVAVWTKRQGSLTLPYIGQLWNYVQAHRSIFAVNNTVIVGDLNSNVCWDRPRRYWNHSDVVRELAAIGIKSAYHHCRSVEQGFEQEPTFYLHRKLDRPYHIDHIFVPHDWLAKLELEVGSADCWLAMSDHMPVTLSVPKWK